MKIQVMFINGSLGAVSTEDLGEMLDKKIIVAFQRSSGLTIVGKDELRSNRSDENGSWRDRKSNRSMSENVFQPSQQALLQSLVTYEMPQKRRELGLQEKKQLVSNLR